MFPFESSVACLEALLKTARTQDWYRMILNKTSRGLCQAFELWRYEGNVKRWSKRRR